MSKAIEEIKHLRIVREYTELVTSKSDLLKLHGHQPTLIKIRKAFQAEEINHEELALVLNNVAITLKGEPEPFANKSQMYEYMFRNNKPESNTKSAPLSIEEQRAIIREINAKHDPPKKKSYSGPRKKKQKKIEAINVSALPQSLRHLVQ